MGRKESNQTNKQKQGSYSWSYVKLKDFSMMSYGLSYSFKDYQRLKYTCIFILWFNFSDARNLPYLIQHTK